MSSIKCSGLSDSDYFRVLQSGNDMIVMINFIMIIVHTEHGSKSFVGNLFKKTIGISVIIVY